MARIRLSRKVGRQIAGAVEHFVSKEDEFKLFAAGLRDVLAENPALGEWIHSTKVRVKSAASLRGKLERKAKAASDKGENYLVDAGNLFTKIDDLAGVRILHLYTKQVARMHPIIMEILAEHKYRVVKRPVAYTWDPENKDFFAGMDIKMDHRDSMYTSIHYIVEANRKAKIRCELQVRTLMEEVWGEVSHSINYPS